ncbi:hypothetical protein JKP88DRAFT_241003 [Tribonema minus]|uniref:Uncharacterized protein n=1 Tax=Tribonema minus TaxID=303371 RepID=A0A835Z652_9STRA|nr:hypothetical protein JKP88DRAFT_241003 [Tribonema minus]
MDSSESSDDESFVARTFKRMKRLCGWPGCTSDYTCKLHANHNAKVRQFQGVKSHKSPDVKAFLVHPATTVMVQQLFDMEPDIITSVGLFGDFIIVTYFKRASAKLRKKLITKLIPDIEVTALGQNAVTLLVKDIVWSTLKTRPMTYPEEPMPNMNFVNFLKNGSWRTAHAVARVIDTILGNMNSNSGRRGHEFNSVNVLQKLIEAFERSDGFCGCGRPECNVELTLNGIKGISPDRRHDHLGYGCPEQVINLICKWHNAPVKHNALPANRSRWESWLSTTTGNIRQNHETRMKTLKQKRSRSAEEDEELRKRAHEERMEALIKKKNKTNEEERLVKEYDASPLYHSSANIRRILVKLRDTTTHCHKCLRALIYGDDGHADLMTLTNVATRASPDRDNLVKGYTCGNTKLVCTSCNFVENEYSRSIIDAVKSTKTPEYALTAELKELCLLYLRALLAIEQGEYEDVEDVDEAKKARRHALRREMFGTGGDDEGGDEGEVDE